MPLNTIATAASTLGIRSVVRKNLNKVASRKAREDAAREAAAKEAALRKSKSPSPKPKSNPGAKEGKGTRIICSIKKGTRSGPQGVKKPGTTGKRKTSTKEQQTNNIKKTKEGRVAKNSGTKGRKVKKEADVAAHDSDDSDSNSAKSITTSVPTMSATKGKRATKIRATELKEKKKALMPKKGRVAKCRGITKSAPLIESSGVESHLESEDEEDIYMP